MERRGSHAASGPGPMDGTRVCRASDWLLSGGGGGGTGIDIVCCLGRVAIVGFLFPFPPLT